MDHDDLQENLLDQLADEFVSRYRRGERPSLSDYCMRHPELAGDIRRVFPTLLVMEQARPGDADSGQLNRGAAPREKLERLGDYRILREIARGGMGIVYEAEQESLGRHVALKVLPTQAVLDPRHLQRFQREARAAARLHHTNIVPVFGVGEHDGLHYYVMQFIPGLGLDQVLDELRRLRGPHKPEASARDREVPSLTIRSNVIAAAQPSAAHIAASLVSGERATAAADAPDRSCHAPRDDVHHAELDGSDSAAPDSAAFRVRSPSSDPSGSGINLLAHDTTQLSQPGVQYWHSVARIGVQVSEAMDYAFGQGVLHRDIKPSNLLLDPDGTVWVTDFGLAKAADSDDLTHTGDVVGTLRYLAPERLRGEVTLGGDIYSLGVTLYEMLTLRPPFQEHDRSRLVRRILEDEPARVREIDPTIPADLETIVMKAIAKDAADRYETPIALAFDLRQFLEDKPIAARPISRIERAWRWCRRNPALAALSTSLLLALTLGLAGVIWKWRGERIARTDAETAQRQIREDLERLNAANVQVENARVHVQNGRWAKAEADLTRAIALRLDHSFARMERGELYCRLGLWEDAAADVFLATKLEPLRLDFDNPYPTIRLACLLLTTGDEQAYRQFCRDTLKRIEPEPSAQMTNYWAARLATLTGDTAADPQRVLTMAQIHQRANPGLDHALYALGAALYGSGEYEQSLRRLLEVEQAEVKSDTGVLSGLQRALAHERLGQPDEARRALKSAEQWLDRVVLTGHEPPPVCPFNSWPDWVVFQVLHARAASALGTASRDATARLMRFRAFMELGRIDEAEAEYARVLISVPEDYRYRVKAFAVFASHDRNARAEAELAEAIQLRPKDVSLHMLAFRHHAARSELDRADAFLDQTVQLEPTNVAHRLDAFHVFAGLGEWERADQQLAAAVSLRPDQAELRLTRFRFHAERDQWDQADAAYARVISDRPDDISVRNACAYFLFWRSHWTRAEQEFDHAIRLQPENPAFWNDRGVCHMRTSRWDEAAADYSRAIELNSNKALYPINRGAVYAEQGRWSEAATDFARGVELNPQAVIDWSILATLRLAAGQTEEYRRICADMLRTFARTQDSFVAETVVFACTLDADSVADHAFLFGMADRMKGSADVGANVSMLGRALFRTGQPEAAIQRLQQAARIYGSESDFDNCFLAMAHFQLGHVDEARRILDRTWDPDSAVPAPRAYPWQERLALRLLRKEAELALAN